MPELRDASVTIGIPGLNGDVTGSSTLANHETRITSLEGNTPPTVLDDLTDVDTTTTAPVSGDRFEFDGTNWVPATPQPITVAFSIPLILNDGGGVLTTGVKLSGIEVPFAATITGWTIVSLTSGSIVCTVNRATYAAQPTYTAISGTEKPTLSSATKNQDLTLSTWTTALAAGDLLQISIDSATTVTSVTVNLRLTRTVGP